MKSRNKISAGLALSVTAHAQTLRTCLWHGNDANPCTPALPNPPSGTNRPRPAVKFVADPKIPATLRSLTVTIIIYGVAGVLKRMLVGYDRGPNDVVNLKGLLRPTAQARGKWHSLPRSALNVDDSVVRGFTTGVNIGSSNPNSFSIANTVLSNNTTGLFVQSPAASTGVISGTQVVNSATGITVTGASSSNSATLTVQNAVVANNSTVGILSNGYSNVSVSNTTVANNGVGVKHRAPAHLQHGLPVTGNGTGWMAGGDSQSGST